MMRRPLEMTASTDNKLISVIMTSSMRMNTGVRIGLLSFDSYLCILRWINVLEHSSVLSFDETYLAFSVLVVLKHIMRLVHEQIAGTESANE